MADPLSISSGILALAGFALDSSISLYKAVQSFQSNQRNIRELREELEALNEVLLSLRETANITDTGLTALELPLNRINKACKDFEVVIAKCTTRSNESKKSFRDWARLTYMGDDILGFKNMLAGYKATIAIALGDANIRAAAVTINVLREYKEMITNTTSDLEEHLQHVDKKLQTLSSRGTPLTNEDATERQQIQEERDSTQQCLDICISVSAHIDQIRPNAFEALFTASDAHQETVTTPGEFILAQQVTANTLKECKSRISTTTSQLQKQLQDIDDKLKKFFSEGPTALEQRAEQETIREEIISAKQCLAICSTAAEQIDLDRTNVVEDVSAAEDSIQVVVATLGDLISAKRVTSGARSTQWIGQMSDASLQQLSRDRSQSATEKPAKPQAEIDTEVQDQYGPGYKLGSARSRP